MKYWKVYYEQAGVVTTGIAQAPGEWSKDRVRRSMKFHEKINGAVLLEPVAEAGVPDFVLNAASLK